MDDDVQGEQEGQRVAETQRGFMEDAQVEQCRERISVMEWAYIAGGVAALVAVVIAWRKVESLFSSDKNKD